MSRALFNRLVAIFPLWLACLTGALAEQQSGSEEEKISKDIREISKDIREKKDEKLELPADIEKWLAEELKHEKSEVYKISFPEGEDAERKRFGNSAPFFEIAADAQNEFQNASGNKQAVEEAAVDMLILTMLHEKEVAGDSSSKRTLAEMLYCRGCCAAWWSQEAESEQKEKEWIEFACESFREAAEKGLLEALYMLGECEELKGNKKGADDYYAAATYMALARAYLMANPKEKWDEKDEKNVTIKSNINYAVDQSSRICRGIGFACEADAQYQKVPANEVKAMLEGDSGFLVKKGEAWWEEGTKDKRWMWKDLARDCIGGMGVPDIDSYEEK